VRRLCFGNIALSGPLPIMQECSEPIEPPEIPPATPGRPSEPPPESPPGSPRPEVPPPVHEPAEPTHPDELPGKIPEELPVRGPNGPMPTPAGDKPHEEGRPLPVQYLVFDPYRVEKAEVSALGNPRGNRGTRGLCQTNRIHRRPGRSLDSRFNRLDRVGLRPIMRLTAPPGSGLL
jgi:hypothetical protein